MNIPSMPVRAVVILCKNATEGLHFYARHQPPLGVPAAYVYDFRETKRLGQLPPDVMVLQTPNFKAAPDKDIQAWGGLNEPSFEYLSFVMMNGTLYPCINIELVNMHGDGRPFVHFVFTLAFGLKAVVEPQSVTIDDRPGRFAITIHGGNIAHAQ